MLKGIPSKKQKPKMCEICHRLFIEGPKTGVYTCASCYRKRMKRKFYGTSRYKK